MSKDRHVNQNNNSYIKAILLCNGLGIIQPKVEDEIKEKSNNNGMEKHI
jgi:hypothetical protein